MFSKSERNAKTSSMGRSIAMVFSNTSTSSSFSQIGTIMPSKEVGCMPRESYSPECVEGEFCEVRAATTTTALPNGASLFALFFVHLKGHRRAGPKLVHRLEQKLNNPTVVLVVGVVAVALNVLLYFGYFLPRMTPLIAHLSPIGISVPEAIGKLGTEAGSKADPKAGSNPQAGSESGPETSAKAGPEGSLASESASPQDSPSNSPPQASAPQDSPSGSPPNSSQGSPSGSPPVSPPPQASASPRASPPPQQQASAPPQSPSGSPPPPELPPLPPPPQQQYQ